MSSDEGTDLFKVGSLLLLLPGRQDTGDCIITMLLGVAGALVGGFFYSILTDQPYVAEFDLGSLAVAVAGAIVLLLLYRFLTRRRT